MKAHQVPVGGRSRAVRSPRRLPILVERLVAMSHDIGVRVVTWTVDEPAVIRRLLDAGVDAIITDRPDVLRDVLILRGEWAPQRTLAQLRPVPRPVGALKTGLN